MKKNLVAASALSLVLSVPVHAEDTPPVAPAVDTPAKASEPAAKKNDDQDNRLLREMVVSAAKDKPVQQRTELGKLTVYTPVSGAVVSKEELEHLQLVNNLLELGKRVPGISMVRNMRIPDGGKAYTESRIDGMRSTSLNTSVFDTVEMSSTERIDVITGPASALYGSGALGGTISMTSRQPPEKFGAKLSQELGSWGFNRTQANIGNSLASGSAGIVVTGSRMVNDGWRNNGAAADSNSAAENKYGGGIKTFFRPTETTKLTLSYDQLHYDYRWAGTLRMTKFDQDWRQSEAGTYGKSIDDYKTKQLRLQQFVGERGEFNFMYGVIDDTSTNYGGAGSGGSNNVICDNSTVNCAAVNNGSAAKTNTLKAGTTKVVTNTMMYRHELDAAKTTVYVGNDMYETTSESATYSNIYTAAQAQNGQWAQGAMTATGQGSITVRKETSPFVHVEVSPTDKLRLHIGDRYGKVQDTADDRTSANKDVAMTTSANVIRSGATYEFDQNHLVWGNLGQTFNPPATSTLLASGTLGNTGYTPAAKLDPEKALTKEIGVRGRFENVGLQYDVALYHATNKGFVVARDCSPAESLAINGDSTKICTLNENAGQLTAKGLESMFSWAVTEKFDVGATYVNSYAVYDKYLTKAGVDYTGNSYQAMPKHRLNLRTAYKPVQGMQVELEADYISTYFISTDNVSGTYSRPVLFNMRASYYMKDWSFWLHALNLTSRHYATRVGISTIAGQKLVAASAGQGNSGSYTPLTIRAGVSYKF
ncbi:MAG: TonB-dependent receptor plug domain-containing protein [Sideroxydans sp.]|nr:TonB-dependent receptor plug domain-containing protein [Sideroxydans sp.]